MQDEFYAVVFRRRIFENLEQLQQELDNWLNFYNNERPHSGRYCYGKTPMQTFNESVILAKQMLLNNVVPAA